MELLKQPINVALGGGGAKGFIHAGVLDGIVSEGLEIGTIVGTSFGAIVGALLARLSQFSPAAGGSTLERQRQAVQDLQTLLLAADFRRLRDVRRRGALTDGSVAGKNLEDWLRTYLLAEEPDDRGARFEQLDLDLMVTVTDARTGNPLTFDRANTPSEYVYKAVRGSASLPYLFQEIELTFQGRAVLCWDVGVTGNCLFGLVHRTFPDRLTIASSLTYRGDVVDTSTGLLGAPGRPLKVAGQVFDCMMRHQEANQLQSLNPAEHTD